MSNPDILNFSLGPVQGFIARARKTRDFWTGSFLLSYLAGQAMAVVLENDGKLILPAAAEGKDEVSDPLLQEIMDRRKGKETNRNERSSIVATLPNRFRAEVPAGFDPTLCEQAIKDKWHELAKIIWDRYLAEPATLGNSTEIIWKRQVDNFWEINWILSEDSAALDLRKNWRNHLPSIEPGDKCTLFGNLQELSGYLRISEKENQNEFWKAVRQQRQAGIFYDLEENERLCSIALIKRLFPHIAADVIYKVPTSYPSTPYLAAINWTAKVVKAKPEEAREYANLASRLPGARGRENPELFPALQKELADNPHAQEFASLDGNCFFKAALENPNLWDKPTDSGSGTKELRKKLVEKLVEIAAPPSPFYAMLLMDGDRLGALLQKHQTKATLISNSLKKFSLKVPSLIKNGNGVTVFAGGDDVLALLPLENALATAIELRSAYLEAFADSEILQATISGAIVYAHFNTPLTEVYHEAQRLLSDVAKEKTGRDSLAVTVWKGAGQVLTWAAPWEVVTGKFQPFLQNFQKEMPNGGKKEFTEFSNSFFYNIQNRLALFADEDADLSAFYDTNLKALLTAEYVKSRGPNTNREKAKETIEQLFELCHRYWRNQNGIICQDKNRLQLDSLFLIKFLSEKGVEQ